MSTALSQENNPFFAAEKTLLHKHMVLALSPAPETDLLCLGKMSLPWCKPSNQKSSYFHKTKGWKPNFKNESLDSAQDGVVPQKRLLL